MLRTASLGLYYEGMPMYGSIGYHLEQVMPEYSETAPLMTLTLSRRENHKIISTLGWRMRHDWGEISWYATGNYTIQGSSTGAWGIGVGVTVQG
jgi:hypothetical protein